VTRRGLRAALVLVVVLVGLRAVLPLLAEAQVNRVLDRTRGYQGQVEDVDLALIRGAYTIEGAQLDDTGGDVPVPIFSSPRIELFVSWAALLRGELVGEVVIREPVVNLVAAPSPQEEQMGTRPHWTERVQALFPVRIDHFAIHGGTLHLRNFHSEPQVDVALRDVEVVARNLSNVRDRERRRPATAEVHATAFGSGTLQADLRIDPLARDPDFGLEAQVEGIDLTQLDDFLRAYLGVDAQRGTLAVYSELDAREGRFDGYVKPLVENLDILDLAEEGDEQGPLDTVWEALAGATAEAFEAQGPDRQAAQIPLEGRFERPDIGFFGALESVLRNAFVEALRPGLAGLLRGRGPS
jgi:hypothetical protein